MTQCRPVIFLVLCFVFAFAAWGSGTLFAQENTESTTAPAASDEQSIRNAKGALGRSFGIRKFPWYSDETDSADFVPFPKEREEKPPKKREERPPREAGGFWAFLGTMGYWTLFGVGLLILAFLLVLAWYVFYRNRDMFHKLWQKEEYKERRRRIETLPEEARDMFDDLIGAANRAFEAGQYRFALIYYFSHQLVWLDMHQLIRMHKGKTNHEYARELKSSTEVLPYYEKSMALFESVYYGDHPITRLQFLSVWEHRHEFSQAVRTEKQRRDEEKLNRAYGSSLAAHRDNLTLTVDMPDADKRATPDTHVENMVMSATAASDSTVNPTNSKPQNANDSHPFQPPPGGMMLLLACLAAMLIGSTGCWREQVQTSYVPMPGLDKSINGATVFHNTIEKRGHALRSGMRTNSYAKNGGVIVWFARHTGCPQDETVKQIEQWLEAKPGRTFVYVGRAYESTCDYWEAVEPLAPTEKDRGKITLNKQEAAGELRKFQTKPKPANNAADKDSNASPEDKSGVTPTKEDENESESQPPVSPSPFDPIVLADDSKIGEKTKCDWFTASRRERAYKVTNISGEQAWTQNINAKKLHLAAFEDWQFADDVEPLLVVQGEPYAIPGDFRKADESPETTEQTFVARKQVGESQAIFVNNAGFLLNYPLVNHEHRKLAGRLIDTFGSPKKRAFLYIGFGEIDFEKSSEVSDESPHVLITLLHIWPISVILCHLIVLCAAFCFYKWPVFGRPKKIPDVQVTDFGKHIDAYAELLAESKDDDYILKQIMEAESRQKRDGNM